MFTVGRTVICVDARVVEPVKVQGWCKKGALRGRRACRARTQSERRAAWQVLSNMEDEQWKLMDFNVCPPPAPRTCHAGVVLLHIRRISHF